MPHCRSSQAAPRHSCQHLPALCLAALLLLPCIAHSRNTRGQAELLEGTPGVCGDDFRGEALSVLHLERKWESKLSRRGQHITIVTQGSMDRIATLGLSCRMWGSSVAVVIYAPLLEGKVLILGEPLLSVVEVCDQLAQLHTAFEEQGRCILDLALYSEEKSAEGLGLYPVNSLRNRALMLASSEAVLLLDFDFLVSRGGAEAIDYAQLRPHLLNKEAIVLPAFESAHKTGRRAEADVRAVLQGGKEELTRLYDDGRVRQFLVTEWDLAQGATNYSTWFQADDIYPVAYGKDYEPYVIVAREGLPWYDERFKGYYFDKVIQLQTMSWVGYKYMVHPSAFTVHYPHEIAAWKHAATKHGLKRRYARMAGHIRQQLKNGTYLPAIMLACQNSTTDPGMASAVAEFGQS